ncbi:hypothetical protein ACLKA7_005471, partial [Drosophila subpalustris]
DKKKTGKKTGSIWVDPGAPTLPEAELLIASLMLASRPDWPISACVGCHVSPPPFNTEELAGHYFGFRYFDNKKIQQENQKTTKQLRNSGTTTIFCRIRCCKKHLLMAETPPENC